MARSKLPHIFLPGPTSRFDYTRPKQRGGTDTDLTAEQQRAVHAKKLKEDLSKVFNASESDREILAAKTSGIKIEFVSEKGYELALESLDVRSRGIRLLTVRREAIGTKFVEYATIFLPNEQRSYFLRKITEYETKETKKGAPRNSSLVNNIATIRKAVLKSFWQGNQRSIPGSVRDWVEAWLDTSDQESSDEFRNLCQEYGIQVREESLHFPERLVCAIYANQAELELIIAQFDNIAEFRLLYQTAVQILGDTAQQQANRVRQLVQRLKLKDHDATSVLILDHGVNNGHGLIKPILRDSDLHTVEPNWGTGDDQGHGTLVAGVAGYGDLLSLLNDGNPYLVTHCLESSKILPPTQANEKRLWGAYTRQGVYLAETTAPKRNRVVCMAIGSEEDIERGEPTSWSGAVDSLASGAEDDHRRLIAISSGNVYDNKDLQNYPISNETKSVYDPAQAWNALTVGAYTEKIQIVAQGLEGYKPVAPRWGLSPFSTTSVSWKQWPIKPEVLFEGGNLARSPSGSIVETDELLPISTFKDPQRAQFVNFGQTSAAASQAAWMAAKIQAAYPSAWPETVRALIVHSASWSDAQTKTHLKGAGKRNHAILARICGFGIPSLERAIYCASNSLTLIAQQNIQPFAKDPTSGRYVTKDMHLYRLPWPMKELQGLGHTELRMRVTLSYFVEPSPGQIGWKHRYRYASHGLRFELNSPGESEKELTKRVNQKAREDGESTTTDSPTDHWLIGKARDVGSIHSDIWQGTAAELANSNLIAVYPSIGWWRERPHLGKWNRQTRYSLIVSIEVPTEEVDIYTPIETQLQIATPISIEVISE